MDELLEYNLPGRLNSCGVKFLVAGGVISCHTEVIKS